MSDTPKKLIVDLAKGTQEYVDLTPEEIQQRELDAIQAATEQEGRKDEEQRILDLKSSAHAKLVAGEPLTEEEAALIIS